MVIFFFFFLVADVVVQDRMKRVDENRARILERELQVDVVKVKRKERMPGVRE